MQVALPFRNKAYHIKTSGPFFAFKVGFTLTKDIRVSKNLQKK